MPRSPKQRKEDARTPEWFRDYDSATQVQTRQNEIVNKLSGLEGVVIRLEAAATEQAKATIRQAVSMDKTNSLLIKIILSQGGIIAAMLGIKAVGSPLIEDITACALAFSMFFLSGFTVWKWRTIPNLFRLFLVANIGIISWRFLDMLYVLPMIPPGAFGIIPAAISVALLYKYSDAFKSHKDGPKD
jgi:hypothetical protein